jgi:predicted RNase H-like HicB family nuclease
MAEQARHRAVYRFDGRDWIVLFPDLGVSTFGRTLAAARRHARSALRVYLEVEDLAEAGAAVEDDVTLPSGAEVERLGAMRRDADELRREVAAETRRTAKRLRAAGLSTRDVGDILGISSTRVAQIERESRSSESFSG